MPSSGRAARTAKIVVVFAVGLMAFIPDGVDAKDWATKLVIAPASEKSRPDVDDQLDFSYRCGLKRCHLTEYVERSKLCAIYVLHAGKPALFHIAPANRDCLEDVERQRFGLASITKSITSVLFGIAFRSGNYGEPIDLDTPIAPELNSAGVHYPDGEVTYRQLLHMSSGMGWDEHSADEGMTIRIEKNEDGSPAGSYRTLVKSVDARLGRATFDKARPYNYSGFDSQLLGVLVEHRFRTMGGRKGETLRTAFERLLWRHLDTRKRAEWNADFDQHPVAYCCSYMAPGDLALLGDYLLQQYRTGKDRMAEWMRESVSNTVRTREACWHGLSRRNFRYGYQWWQQEGEGLDGGFMGIGIRGQFLHLFPEQNVVIVQFGNVDVDWCEAMLAHRAIADTLAGSK